jgi:cyclopropane fatty-acyl-phospholipid synthase-like methyltransferase
VKTIVGVDISQRMVDEYNRRVANQGLSMQEMRAVRADILNPTSDEAQSMEGMFNVVVVSLMSASDWSRN